MSKDNKIELSDFSAKGRNALSAPVSAGREAGFGWDFDNSSQLRYLYGLRFIKDLIGKIAGFFIPLFLFQLSTKVDWLEGFDFSLLQSGIFIIASYYLVMRIGALLSSFIVARIISIQGTRSSFLLAALMQSVWLLSLGLSESHPLFLYLAAVVNGLHINFFYSPYYALLSRNTQKRHSGQDLSLLQLIIELTSVIAPALSGFIIVTLGYNTLFLLSFLGVIISLIIIAMMDTQKFRNIPNLSELKNWLKEKQYRKLSISYAGRYFNDAAIALWPLYVYLILGSVDKVGYLYSLSLFLAMMIIIFTGFYVDHHKNKKPFFFSGGIMSLIWLVRIQIVNIWSIAIVDTFNKMTSSFHWLFYDSLFLKRAKGGRDLSFFVYRELLISAFAIIFWSAVCLVFLLPFDWIGLFSLAAVGVLMSLLVSDKYDKYEQEV